MESLSLPKWLQITFDKSYRISGASEQSSWNGTFYRVCRVKANGELKPEYLLKCLKRKCLWWYEWKDKNLSKQLSLQKQDAGSQYFVAFLDYPRLSIECESIFWSKKYIAFSAIRNCILKRDMEFKPFYLLINGRS